ncbi:asparagine synthase (glutamine-hydrolyzing) [Castellaniella sp.]|uniref:asparagine synthase (glutamine-hydrolyzing) n=1 Tax=Castellaniella sp. TaxID=1955812 RepID=UPI002AFDCD1D|nr:asparagine synthase (glutamine-hydrolyzing) [Castellaniella sp.]
MCGLVGFLGGVQGGDLGNARAILGRMADTIVSRGPDDAGVWADEAGIGLAHRRLSILDLSPAGHQPMACASGRYRIAFNGEIYNHLDLRRELDAAGGQVWRGHSDTETLLAGFVAWGIRATIERCIGMFAFAVWDRQDQVLTLGRDRLGEKPLYYGWQGQGDAACFLFGSELKALKAHPRFAAAIDRDALCLLMRHNYIPAPHSIYRDLFKLAPGCLLTVSQRRREPQIETYWSLADTAVAGVRAPFSGSAEQATDALETLLMSAVGQQMMADVPLGAFLSGGIDSSTVVALMQAQSSRPVKTFSIGFHEDGYNEAEHAQAVARHLGTEHTELYVTPQQALDVIPRLPELYSEPFADSSQIPTFLVSQLARQQVTVSLSGDAGDELFAGYGRYTRNNRRWAQIARVPYGVRRPAAAALRTLSPAAWQAVLGPFRPLMPAALRHAHLGEKLHQGAGMLAARRVDDLYLESISRWEPADLVIGGHEPLTCLRGRPLALDGLDPMQRLMALDAMTYLPDDILVKVDRAAMGVSLESRVPFLDHRVVAFAWQLPQSFKLRDGAAKWILRQVLYRHVPRELIERPKMGFGVPVDRWLRGPLRDWAEHLLDESRLRREGFFHPAPVRRKWDEHLSGRRNWQYHLWGVLMFQAWLEHEGGADDPS